MIERAYDKARRKTYIGAAFSKEFFVHHQDVEHDLKDADLEDLWS
jgi:hypothetical protein